MKKPNILIINSDQHRYDCIAANGNAVVKTPNLDTLMQKGMSFENAFTLIPLCCPARQSFLCGVIPEIHGQLWNYDCSGHVMEGLDPAGHHIWVHQLKDAGYSTAYLGKWHVSPDHGPKEFGFDHVVGEFDYPHLRGMDATWDRMENIRGIDMSDQGPVETSRTHSLAGACIDYIEQFEKDGTPWHIRLDFPEPHFPCFPTGKFADMYDPADIPPWDSYFDNFENKPFIQKQQLYNWGVQDWSWSDWSKYIAHYYGIISQCDEAIGNIIRYLEEHNLTEDTLIVYTTDHGDAAGSHRMLDKHYIFYENIVHVPLIIRWDGHIEPGCCNHDLISHYLDLPVTLLDLLGLDVPDGYQGLSFKSVLDGEKHSAPRDYILSSYNGQQFGLYTQRMIRDNDFKFIWNLTDVSEFYDLHNDPSELHNLIDVPEFQDMLNAYRRKLYDALRERQDPLVEMVWMKEILLNPYANPNRQLSPARL